VGNRQFGGTAGGDWRRLRAAAGLTGAVLLFATACSSGGGAKPNADTAGKTADVATPAITITPADGSGKAQPDQGISIVSQNGALDTVSVQLKGKEVPGTLSADKTSWKSDWTLTPNSDYTVTATAKNTKKSATATSKFHTLKASSTLAIDSVYPSSGMKVGVGMPIIVNFNRAVSNKKGVEKALEVKSDQPNEGAWYWYGDSEAIFRTKQYWDPNQKISFTAHLAGIKQGTRTYGTANTTVNFKIGDSHISKVSTKTHRMKVYLNGKQIKNIGISAGRGGIREYTTTNGVHLTMEKGYSTVMESPGRKPGDPGYYKETVYWVVRISNSGEFVHSAPWSVSAQGHYNVSHGCVNAPPSFAKWFEGWSYVGDVVDITGTNRQLEFDNGYGYWQKSWASWLKGSETGARNTTDTATDTAATPSASTSAAPSLSTSASPSASTTP
jgi:lipoprotein-anchoring transpeptidase ErfK/SrfK